MSSSAIVPLPFRPFLARVRFVQVGAVGLVVARFRSAQLAALVPGAVVGLGSARAFGCLVFVRFNLEA